MSRLESLKVLISQRLTAAVEELFGHLETTISEYEEEVKCRYHKLLDAASEAEGELQTAAVQQRLVIKEEDDFEGPHIKEEKHDFWSSQDLTSRLQGPHGEDTTAFPFSHIYVKNEENREAEPSSSSSPELMRAEANGEDCGGPDANRTCAQDISGLSGSDDTSLGCCQAKTEDCADDWKEIRKCQSSVNTMKKGVPENDVGDSTVSKSFNCSKCGRRFGQKHHLLTHMRCHTGEKPFSCSLCGRRFTQKGNLTQHLTIHSREKAFSCPVCGEKFAQKGNLTQHLTVHTRENPCSCPICGERFAQQGSLTQHLTVHTEVNPCSCPVCGERFAQKGNLTQHMTVHKREKLCW